MELLLLLLLWNRNAANSQFSMTSALTRCHVSSTMMNYQHRRSGAGTLQWAGIGALSIPLLLLSMWREVRRRGMRRVNQRNPLASCLWKLRNEKWQAINFKWLIVNNTLIPRQRNNTLALMTRNCIWRRANNPEDALNNNLVRCKRIEFSHSKFGIPLNMS